MELTRLWGPVGRGWLQKDKPRSETWNCQFHSPRFGEERDWGLRYSPVSNDLLNHAYVIKHP